MALCPPDAGGCTFCAAVRSSARAAARFLAHWLSCMADAWSEMVGTVALAAATIFPPGYKKSRQRKLQWPGQRPAGSLTPPLQGGTAQHGHSCRPAPWGPLLTCKKFWLAAMSESWALGLSGWAWLPRTPCTSIGIWSATTCTARKESGARGQFKLAQLPAWPLLMEPL